MVRIHDSFNYFGIKRLVIEFQFTGTERQVEG
jgi:hypothetical protein